MVFWPAYRIYPTLIPMSPPLFASSFMYHLAAGELTKSDAVKFMASAETAALCSSNVAAPHPAFFLLPLPWIPLFSLCPFVEIRAISIIILCNPWYTNFILLAARSNDFVTVLTGIGLGT